MRISPSGAAALVALGLIAAGAALAVAAVPWSAAVAPWADLRPGAVALAPALVGEIEAYAEAAWLPATLALVAGAALAVAVLAVPALDRRRVGGAAPLGDPGRGPEPRRGLLGVADRMGRGHRWIGDLAMAALLLVAVCCARLPFDLWLAAVRRDHGLLLEPWSAWAVRWLAYAAIDVVLGATACTLVLACARRWPRRWWPGFIVGAAAAAFALSYVVPLTQVAEGTRSAPDLEGRVQAIAERAGVDVGTVLVAETSDRSPALNATVSGLGPSRTVTVYDTVLDRASPAEIEALIAHELVHVRENDVLLGTALAAIGAAALAAVASALMLSGAVQRRLGASGPGDTVMVAVLVAVALVGSLVATPLAATMSRALEWRADREAMAITGDPEAYASLMATLAAANKSTLEPPRWRYALLFTHPTPPQRMAAAEEMR